MADACRKGTGLIIPRPGTRLVCIMSGLFRMVPSSILLVSAVSIPPCIVSCSRCASASLACFFVREFCDVSACNAGLCDGIECRD